MRSLDKAPNLDMEFVEADVLEDDGWDKVLEGAVGLFHLATIYATSGDGQLILDTANKGTEIVFRGQLQSRISRIVYTSSVAAIGSTPKGEVKDETVGTTIIHCLIPKPKPNLKEKRGISL